MSTWTREREAEFLARWAEMRERAPDCCKHWFDRLPELPKCVDDHEKRGGNDGQA